jgi:hypothetical protein
MALLGSDDFYSIEEIASVTGISWRTMYRWREQGYLLTRYDFEIDPAMMESIIKAIREGRAGQPLRGKRMPEPRLFLEDATRMLVIGHLGVMGWDRTRLLEPLGWPYAIHISPGQEPHWMGIAPDGKKLDRYVTSNREELDYWLERKPMACVIDLNAYRAQMLGSFAELVKIREKRAMARANQPREQGRFVAAPEARVNI